MTQEKKNAGYEGEADQHKNCRKKFSNAHIDYSLVIAPVVAELCTTSVALSAPPNSFQNNSQS